MQTSRFIIFFLVFSFFSLEVFSAPKGKKTGVTFDKALPEDISNENFPDRIESFDFPDASLFDLVKAIGKLTGINFIVDPGLRGKKISIIAPSPITVAEAYKAFLSALAANGYTIVKSGAFWKIQTLANAHKDNTEVYSDDYFPNTDQLITRIIKLQYINAKDFQNSIKWLLSQDNKISSHEGSNSIILSDYGSVIERIMKIVEEMDVPGSEEGIKIIPIEHASAEELANILSELLAIKSRKSSYMSPRNRRKGAVTLSPNVKSVGNLKISNIIPDLRTNSLVVSANAEGVRRVRELVKKLDTPVDASRSGGVYVYNVLYGTAEEVYNTLMGIKTPSGANNNRFSNFRNNPRVRGNNTLGKSTTGSKSPLFQNVTIMADSNTNSLIISAKNKYNYEKVLSVLKKIDVPRDQVFIQAIIVEMIVNKGDNKDINLAGAVGSLLDNIPFFKNIAGSSFAGFLNRSFDIASLQKAQFGPGLVLGLPILNLLQNVVGSSQNNNFSLSNADSILNHPEFTRLLPEDKSRVFSDLARSSENTPVNQALKASFFPLLRLLKTASNVNVLSTPQLTTLDNVSAFIEVGENAPVGLTSTATVGALAQNSVDRQDITLRLDITPRINPESSTVQMDIKQKFDDFSNRSSSASELASRGVHIIKRNIETKMVLNDGETAVLGGLLTDKEVISENKVPFLGDVPILGWLFKGSNIEKEKRNLLVFITPTIIRGKDQKEKTKQVLGKKLEERIDFVKKHMKGRDPHGQLLDQLIPESSTKSQSQAKEEFGNTNNNGNEAQEFTDQNKEDFEENGNTFENNTENLPPFEQERIFKDKTEESFSSPAIDEEDFEEILPDSSMVPDEVGETDMEPLPSDEVPASEEIKTEPLSSKEKGATEDKPVLMEEIDF